MMRGSAALSGDKIIVKADYLHRDAIKSIPGREWDPFGRQWILPATAATVEALRCVPGMQIDAECAKLAPIDVLVQDTVDADVKPFAPMPIKVKPYAHQIAAYNLGISQNAAAYLHEQGTGKSLTAVSTAGRRFLDGQITKLLVVAPLAVLPVWEKEFDAYSTVRHLVKILQGTMEQRKAMLRDLNKAEGSLLIAVINYEAMWRLEEVLTDWRPDMIIADESQRIKNPTAKQSKAMHELGRLAKYRLILTGTPVSNTPLDFWSQYKFLDPSIFEKSYYAFRNHYAAYGGYGGYELVAYKHLDELTRKAHSIAHRVTKAQALDLPERIDQYLYCDLEASAERIYKQLVRDKVAELSAAAKVTAPQVVTQMLRLSQLTGGYLRPDDSEQVLKVSSAKIGLLRETLEDLLDAGEKVVIFCRFLAEIGEISGMATELVGSAGWCGIWGEIPGDQRGEAVRRFQEDSEVQIFIAQIQTAGAGITLHAASNAIFYSLDYSYNNYDQAKARIHRIGQHHPCTYIHLVVKGSIDEQVIGALAEKRSIADDVVDNWRTIFGKEKK